MELGRYRVGDVVGTGRTGRVMRGTRADDGADVAVRQVPPRMLEERDVRRAVKNLPFRCFGLRSPVIVPVLDAFEISGSVAVVEPWVEGFALRTLGSRLPLEDAVPQLVALLGALGELHERGTVHGDVRAANILLSAEGPRLVGLGLADVLGRRTKAAKDLGATDAAEMGDAPELTDQPADPLSDLYGLAAAYRAALPEDLGPQGEALRSVLMRASALDRADRFADAGAFLAAVRGTTGDAAPPPRVSLDVDFGFEGELSVSDVEPAEPSLSDAPSSTAYSVQGPDSARTAFASPKAPGPGAGPTTAELSLADAGVEPDAGPKLQSETDETEDVPDDVTTAGRYPSVVDDEAGGGVADYRWLMVSGGFTAALVGAYFLVTFIGSLLPDLPDGMVEVPAGVVRVGAESGPPPERPGFEYEHPRFFIDRAEVTVAEFQACVATGECTPTSGRIEGSPPAGDMPVVGVTWLQAQSFCNNAGKRLPTENEWEAAARRFGGTYGTGDLPPSCEDAVYGRIEGAACSHGGRTGADRAQPPGDGDPAPVDFSGNVWEFVDADWSEGRGPGTGEASPAGGSVLKVIKGGGWASPVSQLRTSARLPVQNIYWAADVGFRCAQVPEG